MRALAILAAILLSPSSAASVDNAAPPVPPGSSASPKVLERSSSKSIITPIPASAVDNLEDCLHLSDDPTPIVPVAAFMEWCYVEPTPDKMAAKCREFCLKWETRYFTAFLHQKPDLEPCLKCECKNEPDDGTAFKEKFRANAVSGPVKKRMCKTCKLMPSYWLRSTAAPIKKYNNVPNKHSCALRCTFVDKCSSFLYADADVEAWLNSRTTGLKTQWTKMMNKASSKAPTDMMKGDCFLYPGWHNYNIALIFGLRVEWGQCFLSVIRSR